MSPKGGIFRLTDIQENTASATGLEQRSSRLRTRRLKRVSRYSDIDLKQRHDEVDTTQHRSARAGPHLLVRGHDGFTKPIGMTCAFESDNDFEIRIREKNANANDIVAY
jgi:hypothetical protein